MDVKKGLVGATLLVFILTPIGVGVSIICGSVDLDICNPVSQPGEDPSIHQQTKIKMAGMVTQTMYSENVKVNDERYMIKDAIRKYTYCRHGLGVMGEGWCTNVPTEEDIGDAMPPGAKSGGVCFMYGQTKCEQSSECSWNSVTYSKLGSNCKPDTGIGSSDQISLSLAAYYRGENVLSTGSGDDGGGSRFVFVQPLPGGEHVTIEMKINKGSFSVGVIN